MIALILASLLWGTTGTAATFLPAAVSPLTVGAATMGVGGVLLFLTSFRGALGVAADRRARPWILAGAVAVVVYPLTFYPAMASAGVAVGNAVSLGSAPLFAVLLEWGFERRRPSGRLWIALAIATAGLVLLAGGGGEAGPVTAASGAGIALGLVAGLAYAGYTYASRRLLQRGFASRDVMAVVFGSGAVPLLVILAGTGAAAVRHPAAVPVLAYLAIGPMFVAYLLFGRGLRRVRSSSATTVTLLEPVTATVLAVVVVGERLSGAGWLGLAGLIAGVLVLVPRGRGSDVPPG